MDNWDPMRPLPSKRAFLPILMSDQTDKLEPRHATSFIEKEDPTNREAPTDPEPNSVPSDAARKDLDISTSFTTDSAWPNWAKPLIEHRSFNRAGPDTEIREPIQTDPNTDKAPII